MEIYKKFENFIDKYAFIFNKLSKDKIGAFAAQAAFFTIISFFPFLMFLTAMIQHIPMIKTSLLDISINLLPASVHSTLLSLIEEIFSSESSGTFLSLTVITTLWAASKAVYALIVGLNVVYDVESSRWTFILNRFLAILYTIAFEIIIIAALIFLVFGNSIMHWIINHLEVYFNVPTAFNLKSVIGFFVLSMVFLLIYITIPSKKLSIKKQLPGTFVSALAWLLFSKFFSFYIENFANYTMLYGSITTVVIFMLWLYACMYILLIGGEINILLAQYHYKFPYLDKVFFWKKKG